MESLPIAPELIIPISTWVITFLCFTIGTYYITSPNNHLLLKKNTIISGLLLCITMIIWIGLRPVSGKVFGDMGMYRYVYDNVITSSFVDIDWNDEWFFQYIGTFCKLMQMSHVGYFLVIAIGYVGFMFVANWKLLWENVLLACLFSFSALFFYSYGVNGIRNGLACSMVVGAVAFMSSYKKYDYLFASILCVLAISVHKSTMLPVLCLIAAVSIVKDVRYALYFWIASIPVSLIAGGAFINYFSTWSFDERMSSYAVVVSDDNNTLGFSHTGFRWDFLLYSAMPVWLISYIAFQRNIKDRAFHIISTVYLLSNAFWVMVCRAAFSNRFAYLSWFLYPLVIAYPIIRMKIWKDQDMRAGWILLAHAGFSLYMFLLW